MVCYKGGFIVYCGRGDISTNGSGQKNRLSVGEASEFAGVGGWSAFAGGQIKFVSSREGGVLGWRRILGMSKKGGNFFLNFFFFLEKG